MIVYRIYTVTGTSCGTWNLTVELGLWDNTLLILKVTQKLYNFSAFEILLCKVFKNNNPVIVIINIKINHISIGNLPNKIT